MADKPRPEVGKERKNYSWLWLVVSPLNLKWIISSPLVWPARYDNLTLLIRQVRKFPARLPGGILGGRENEICFKVHKATRWTIRHGLMLLWFKDLMNVTEKLQFIDPTFQHSCLVSSSSPLMNALDRSVERLGLWIVTSRLHSLKSLSQSSIKTCLKFFC